MGQQLVWVLLALAMVPGVCFGFDLNEFSRKLRQDPSALISGSPPQEVGSAAP